MLKPDEDWGRELFKFAVENAEKIAISTEEYARVYAYHLARFLEERLRVILFELSLTPEEAIARGLRLEEKRGWPDGIGIQTRVMFGDEPKTGWIGWKISEDRRTASITEEPLRYPAPDGGTEKRSERVLTFCRVALY